MEIAVGYVFAWALGKAKRVGRRADADVDTALDNAMDHLDTLVRRKLHGDPALHELTEQAQAEREAPRERTRERVRLALEDAAEQDPAFAGELDHAVKQVQAHARATGAVSAGDSGQAVGGSVIVRADHGAVAGWTIGNVTMGNGNAENPPPPGPSQG
ncbi:hypothetical protein ACFXI6_51375 [Streptomyces mirabilis]|uniref:hypothetical protein n=1 Tax=Streptomyces mirabilis TaxID=68239 RepID=UPI00367CFBC0